MELELAVPAVQSLKNIFNPPIDSEQIVHYSISMEGGNRASDPARGNEMNKLISVETIFAAVEAAEKAGIGKEALDAAVAAAKSFDKKDIIRAHNFAKMNPSRVGFGVRFAIGLAAE